MNRKALFGIAIVALGLLAVFGMATYMPGLRPHLQAVPAEGERTIVLELIWGGDTYSSTEASCDVWTAQYECELRRGGSLGVVMTDTLPLTGPVADTDPPASGVIVTTTLTWPLADLAVGPYETWCRLDLTNGETTIWGYVEGQGQELDGYCLADKFAIGQTCIVPRRFQAWVE